MIQPSNTHDPVDAEGDEGPGEPENAEGGDKEPKMTVKGTGEKAFDVKAFRRIADLVTTQKEDVLKGLVNVNTAPYEVLACLPGLDETLARAIVHEREGREEGFATTADLLDVDGISTDVFKKVCARVSARSDVFSVRSFGVLHAGDLYCCARAIIDRTEDTTRLRYWREHE